MKTIKILLVLGFIIPMIATAQPKKNANKKAQCYALTLPKQDLSQQEKDMLIKMREEEKLAHDVYAFLFDKWGLPIFNRIASSEANHTQKVKLLLQKYDLQDPSTGEAGKFNDPELQKLYNQLTEQGSKSLKDALIVGATIEDLDIYDLENYLKQTDNDDISILFTHLKRASGHHLKAFTFKLKQLYDYEYKPQYISEDEYKQIISKPPKGRKPRKK